VAGSESEFSEICMMAWSAGVTFCIEGVAGMFGGSLRETTAMPFCTSCAAESMPRSREVMVIVRKPQVLLEVIESRPAMVENCRSSGAATEEARVSDSRPEGWPAPGWSDNRCSPDR
jgi:hypothetical protein